MRPLGHGGGAAGEISRRAHRRGSGKGRSGPRESHATDLWLKLGSGRHRQGGATARRFPGRCGWVRRWGGGLGEQGVAQEAVLDLGWGTWMLWRPEKLVARKLNAGAQDAAVAARCQRPLCALTRGGPAWSLYPTLRRWESALRVKTAESRYGQWRQRRAQPVRRRQGWWPARWPWTRGERGMRERRRWSTARSSCARRVAPVGSWRPCRAHGGVYGGGTRSGVRRRAAHSRAPSARNVSKQLCLRAFFSKNFNRSGPRFLYQSCTPHYPLKLCWKL
jgi:hypothetical protein